MRFPPFAYRFFLLVLLYLGTVINSASSKEGTYNSLLWEISGNGLSRPSYLFGTMHISNKMVFHLSDSFYAAIRNSDIVAIEINPETWQYEIPRVNRQTLAFQYYLATYYTDYLRENSFTGSNFTEQLQQALRFEPVLNDQLLYRSERGMDNFQEDTYLDLYIYQTGKKLGKEAAGVETFIGSQRMMIEAYMDMAKDNSKTVRSDNTYTDVIRDMQDAYRRGNLDMLDSLNKATEQSPLFTEKFLYQRNRIQADAMDSLMKKKSLFAAVGAAHLPGPRGVIELLRKKGYTLRPIYMQDRDAIQKAAIDTLSVPVQFITQYAADSFFKVDVPGRLNDVESDQVAIKHYADMANGSYYLVTRIGTDNIYNGRSEQNMLQLIDSLLYENIPGRILSKKQVSKSGYKGWDIINRTRNNNIQRYQIWVTPFEIIIFKMGGQGSYVYGKESESFFGSITFRDRDTDAEWYTFTPSSGGFSLRMPSIPGTRYTLTANDNLPEWRYEAVDPSTGDRYAVFRKSMYSFDFIGADTFDLDLMIKSFCSNKDFELKEPAALSYRNGLPVADAFLKAKNGDYLGIRAILSGGQYYLLVCRSATKEKKYKPFFDSFKFTDYTYPTADWYTDSLLNFTVRTPVQPALDADVADMISYMKKGEAELRNTMGYNNKPLTNYANFISEETGEVIVVNTYAYPEYYYVRDNARFWTSECTVDSSLVLHRKLPVSHSAGERGFLLEFSDTATRRLIKKLVLLKGHTLLTAHTMVDSGQAESSFIRDFYTSLRIHSEKAVDIFTPKAQQFIEDYNSTDSTIRKRAKSALSSVYFGGEGYPCIKEALVNLPAGAPDYIEQKNALILELGFINDTAVAEEIAVMLRDLYQKSGDTVLFTNSIIKSLSRLMGTEAGNIFKTLLLQDPPVFEELYEYHTLFAKYHDSLKYAVNLYPELLNLASIPEFKEPVRALLLALVDSGLLDAGLYEDYAGNILFDAKVSLKKIQRQLESDRITEAADNRNMDSRQGARIWTPRNMTDNEVMKLNRYINLLIPYYTTNPSIKPFFDKLLTSEQNDVSISAATALLKAGQSVPPDIWQRLAQKKISRVQLWSALKEINRTDLFPSAYRQPDIVAEDALYASMSAAPDTMTLAWTKSLGKGNQKTKVYFFKYRWKKEDEWKLAFSTLHDTGKGNMEAVEPLVMYTTEKWDGDQKLAERLYRQAEIGEQPSGRFFYDNIRFNPDNSGIL